jgi:hypothetical protein
MEHEIQGDATLRKKSTFVNVLAWIFIIFGGFATFIGILQNILIHVMFPKDFMNQGIQQTKNAEQVPAFVNFMINHFDLVFLFFLIVSTISFISAIALLKRKNWARIVFIILLALGILWNVGAIAMMFTMFNTVPAIAGKATPPGFEKMMLIMKIASLIMVVGISSLFLWVIKKLTSAPIKAEFA